MALIKCPECGREVSSYANACHICGFPIANANPCGTVVIKIASGLIGTIKVHNMDTGAILWQGKAGQIARFDVESPTHIGLTWGLMKKPPREYQVNVKARERYELSLGHGFAGGYGINQVDVIDSD